MSFPLVRRVSSPGLLHMIAVGFAILCDRFVDGRSLACARQHEPDANRAIKRATNGRDAFEAGSNAPLSG